MDLKIIFSLKCSLACALCTILIEATLLYSSPSKPWNEKRAQSSLFFLLLRTELSWNIKTIKVKIANWRASCLDSSYIYCIEGFLRRQNKSGDSLSVFNSSFSPHWKCHCPPPFPSFTFPPSHWPRLLSHGRCTDGARLEIAKTWTIICLTERRTLRAEGWGQSSLRFFCDSLSRSQVTLNTLPVHRATRTV